MTEEVESRPCRGASLGNFDGRIASCHALEAGIVLSWRGPLDSRGGLPRVIGPPIPPAIPGCLQTAHSSSIQSPVASPDVRTDGVQRSPLGRAASHIRQTSHRPARHPR